MPAGKVYVATSPELTLAVQRHPKALSFWYLGALFGKRLAAVSQDTGDKMMANVHGEEEGPSFFWDAITFTVKILKPGPGLDGMNRVMVQSVASLMDELAGKGQESFDLWEWIRHVMTMATTESVYGPLNPYRDRAVEEAFW